MTVCSTCRVYQPELTWVEHRALATHTETKQANRVVQRARSIAKFWSRVEKTATCWVFRGPLSNTGYATAPSGGTRLGHRWVYENTRGPIPAGTQLDHLCRNRACVNPEHLEVVTPSENIRRARCVA